MAHMCEPKRRYLQKDEKRVQVGFLAFNKFYTMVQRAKPRTYSDFCKSSYYNAFVKFGSFVTNINPLYPEKFVDFVIKEEIFHIFEREMLVFIDMNVMIVKENI